VALTAPEVTDFFAEVIGKIRRSPGLRIVARAFIGAPVAFPGVPADSVGSIGNFAACSQKDHFFRTRREFFKGSDNPLKEISKSSNSRTAEDSIVSLHNTAKSFLDKVLPNGHRIEKWRPPIVWTEFIDLCSEKSARWAVTGDIFVESPGPIPSPQIFSEPVAGLS